MDKKIKTSSLWAWTMIVLLGLLGVIFLMQMRMAHRVSPEMPSTGVLNPEPISTEAESASQVNIDADLASRTSTIPKIVNPETVAPETVVTANKPSSVKAVPYVPGQSSQDKVVQQDAQEDQEDQETQETSINPINAPMTDQQILESIQQQDQKQQTKQQIIAKRDAAAAEVMRIVETAQSQPTNSQQVIPSSYSSAVAPDDIRAKLESHQLTAH